MTATATSAPADDGMLATGFRSSIRPVVAMTAATFRADRVRAAGTLLLHTIAGVGAPISAAALAALITAAQPGSGRSVVAAALLLSSCIAASVVLSEISWKISHQLEEKTAHLVDREIIEVVAGLPDVEHLERADHLDKLDRLREQRSVFGESSTGLVLFAAVLVSAVTTLALLARTDPLLLVLPIFVVPSIVMTNRADVDRLRTLERRQADRRQADDYLELATSPRAGKELRIFGLAPELLRRHWDMTERIAAWEKKRGLRGARMAAFGRTTFAIGYIGAIALAVIRVSRGEKPIADLVLTVVLAGQVMNMVGSVNGHVTWLTEQMMTVRRYLWLLDYAKAHRHRHGTRPAPARLDHGIEVRDLSFAYPGTGAPVLRHVNLQLRPGTTVAIVGNNGAGKTTLVKLLARLYQPTGGEILIDGVPLDDIDVESWRSRFSAAFQDHARLELSAQHNVGIGDLPHIDDPAAVLAALDRGAATDVLEHLPNGLATQLGAAWPGGVDLSGGQWQKLAIGRGMMRSAPLVLVLDEPTAALDAETEHKLFERYAQAADVAAGASGTITILISHRFSTVRTADWIVVVSGGEVAEQGTHDGLIQRGGLYAELFELQARAYR
jgi:ATP-binding cassette, subfamily B, bacterial